MLIQFRFKNYKSFKEENIFDMSATSQREHSDFLIEKNENKILPVVAFFGGNANGKSNFIDAFFAMLLCIVVTYDIDKDRPLPISQYIFKPNNKEVEPTAFEIVLAINEVEYKYGFVLDKKKIYQEWLLYKPFKKNSTAQYKKLFERENQEITLYNQFTVHEPLKKLVKEKNLFLSILGRRGEEIARDIFDWVLSIGFERLDEDKNEYIFEILDRNKKLFQQVKDAIKEVDPCIYDMKIQKEINELTTETVYKLKTIHKISENKVKSCPFAIESEGTKKLFYLFYKIYEALEDGGVLFIDELDSKIHSLVLNHIVRLFNNREINKNNAQLIFTCHNTWFLDNRLLRRDQIWFITKNEEGVSTLYSLSDFKDIRNDLDYNKAYLAGKFGAIPYMERSTNGDR